LSSYRVTIELDAPSSAFDVSRVAAAIGAAIVLVDETNDLVINRLDVEREDA